MQTKIVCGVIAMAGFAGPVLAVNKCIGPGGAVSFQEAPCTGVGGVVVVKPAAGEFKASAQPGSGSEADRLNAISEGQSKNRKLWEMDNSLMPHAQRQLAQHKAWCAAEMQRLERNKYIYEQNLYGKTHAAQVASEQAALSSTCATKQREFEAAVDELVKRRAAMVAELQKP